MNFKYMLLLLILSQIVIADCAGYVDEFSVRVLDSKNRPIEGADVWIKFDRGTLFGEQYFTTEIRQTDAAGKVDYQVINQGTNTREIDCTIVINGSAGGGTKKIEVEANSHGPIVDVILDDVYPVKFYVRDHLNAPIENASVTIGDKSGKTNEYGYVKYLFVEGSYDYLSSYEIAKQAGTIVIEGEDVEFAVIFPHYHIYVDVLDDYGDPLPVNLTVLNETVYLPDGHYENEKIFGDYIPYKIGYKGLEKNGEILAIENPRAEIILDIHAPLFGEVVSETINNRTKLNIPISDPGADASGVDVKTLQVQYRLEPADASTPWNTAVVFTTGFNTFAAEFPELAPDSIVQFTIEVKDKEGNKATLGGKFSTLVGTAPPINNTQNQTNPQETPGESQEIPLLYIIVVVFVVIFAIILVKKLKSNE
ncbi:MAG: hypothetical protein ABH983_03695 [Candidatus Micrarchaeota archaeon]